MFKLIIWVRRCLNQPFVRFFTRNNETKKEVIINKIKIIMITILTYVGINSEYFLVINKEHLRRQSGMKRRRGFLLVTYISIIKAPPL